MSNSKSAQAAVAGILALGMAGTASAVPDAPQNWEKCGGVAMAGKNDCGSLNGSHGCASSSKVSNDTNEWVYTPEGTCAKIGGTVAMLKPAK